MEAIISISQTNLKSNKKLKNQRVDCNGLIQEVILTPLNRKTFKEKWKKRVDSASINYTEIQIEREREREGYLGRRSCMSRELEGTWN